MSRPETDYEFTALFREYLERLKKKLTDRLEGLEPGAIEKGLSSLVAALAMLVLLAGKNRKRDGIIGVVLNAAARYLAKHGEEKASGDG